jgi:SAM-dependent methyltransferase
VSSVADVGCGIGTWANQFLKCGVKEVTGIDGAYVDPAMLRIPQECFYAHDLRSPIPIDRRYDLAVCLEVTEHLPISRADGIINDLVSLAPCVLFSAAVPGQGGTDHINEQYLSWWKGLFGVHDYVPLDLIRHQIWDLAEVDWWYRQNVILFVHKSHYLAQRHKAALALDYIRPELAEQLRGGHPPGMTLRALTNALIRSTRARLKGYLIPTARSQSF